MSNLTKVQQKVYSAVIEGASGSSLEIAKAAGVAYSSGSINYSLHKLRDMGLITFTTHKAGKRTMINYNSIEVVGKSENIIPETSAEVDEEYTNEQIADLLELAVRQLRRNEQEMNEPKSLLQRLQDLI